LILGCNAENSFSLLFPPERRVSFTSGPEQWVRRILKETLETTGQNKPFFHLVVFNQLSCHNDKNSLTDTIATSFSKELRNECAHHRFLADYKQYFWWSHNHLQCISTFQHIISILYVVREARGKGRLPMKLTLRLTIFFLLTKIS
jgi:hypothetical protein